MAVEFRTIMIVIPKKEKKMFMLSRRPFHDKQAN